VFYDKDKQKKNKITEVYEDDSKFLSCDVRYNDERNMKYILQNWQILLVLFTLGLTGFGIIGYGLICMFTETE
jgi:hypothetical protein